MNYRNDARQSLERAKALLDKNDGFSVRYAAIELRMSFEGLIYERGKMYQEELPLEIIDTWQPKKILNMYMEIDPHANHNSELKFGIEEALGVPAKEMKSLGEETILSLKDLKKYYDKLGSYIHTPTLKQLRQGKVFDADKARLRCDEIVVILERVFGSPIHNINFKSTAKMDCEKCGSKIVRRIPSTKESVLAKCMKCEAEYTLESLSDGRVEWKGNMVDVRCSNGECDSTMPLWHREISPGTCWDCNECGTKNVLALCVIAKKDEEVLQDA